MIRRITLSIAVAGFLTAILVACASTPKAAQIPARESTDDCLVLLPVQFKNATGAVNARKYAYVFGGDYGNLVIPNRTGFVVLVTHESTVTLEKLITYVKDSGAGIYGSSEEWKVNIQLPYEPGKIVVAPFTFTLRYESDNAGGFMCYSNMVQTDENQMRETLAMASQQKNAETWLR